MFACLLLVAAVQGERFPEFAEQDAIAYELDLDVDPAARRLKGTVTYRFVAVEPLASVRLHSTPGDGWAPRFLDLDGTALRATWEGDVATVLLPAPVEAGMAVVFRAELDGLPPDGFYFKDSRYQRPLAFTDHYSIRARGWLPCEDHPADRATFRVRLRYPEGNVAIASGTIVEDTDGEVWQTHSDIPPYMFAIVVGDFAKVPEEGDPRLMPHLVYREDVKAAKRALVDHAKWIAIMENTFGRYVYGKYAVVQCPTRWGGFEAPGNTQLSERLFDRGDGGKGTLAHELVHMWFGDAVGYAKWREVWLSEGFASYFGPWLYSQTGGPSLKDAMVRQRERWRRSAESRRKSIRYAGFEHPDAALNANTYPKGAWVLHMLRGELGDHEFFDAISAFYREHSGSSVVTTDFVDSVEATAGVELDWFFDQWLDRVGCPELEVRVGEEVTIAQVQPGEPYRFRLKLAWEERGARRERTVEIDGRRTAIAIRPDEGSLILDPDVELLYRAK